MRRVIIVLLVLAAAGAAVWYFMFRGAAGSPPALAAQLDKTHTIGFASVEKPDVLLSKLLAVAEKQTLPPEAQAGLKPEARTQALGFDPATPAGWAEVGIDPVPGVGVAVDARLGGRPYVIAKIADEAKLLAWLGKRNGAEARIADGTLTVGTMPPLAVARRSGFTLFAEGIAPADLKAIADAKGPALTESEGFAAAFAGAAAGGRFTAFAPVANLKKLRPFSKGELAASVDFYATLFPAIGGFGDVDDFRVRLVTSEKGRAALKQIISPAAKAPAFSKWLPAEGWAAFRYSINLKELFTGLQGLLPPAVPEQVRTQLGLAPMALAMVGIDWNEVTEAFTGHVAFAIKPGEGQPELLTLMALGNPEKADKVLEAGIGKLTKLLRGMRGAPLADIEIDGAKGKRFTVDGRGIVLVRKGDMLILGSSEQVVRDAIARSSGGASLAGTPAGKFLDRDAAFVGTVNVAQLMPKGAPAQLRDALKGLPPMQAAVRLDRHGLAFEGKTISLMASAGFAAYFMLQQRQQMRRAVEQLQIDQERRIKEAMKIEPARDAPASALSAPAPAAPASAATP